MRNDYDHDGHGPEESLNNLLAFLDEDPLEMNEAELDLYLDEAGLDFQKFNTRLTSDMETAVKKARLSSARANRASFLTKAKHAIDIAGMTIEQKRAEIQQRLGLLDGNAALVYNRNYETAEDEDDLDDLLSDLRSLDERADDDRT